MLIKNVKGSNYLNSYTEKKKKIERSNAPKEREKKRNNKNKRI